MSTRYFLFAVTLLIGAQGLLTPAVFAADGRREINQTCAVETGCFPGDFAGFPVSISESGSYLLTGNLVVTENKSAIALNLDVNDVTLDLNGFTLIGDSVNNGIQISNNQGVEIRGGTVRQFNNGVQVSTVSARDLRFVNVRILDNGGYGLHLGNTDHGAEVRGCTVIGNGNTGIYVGQNGLVVGNRVVNNGVLGISMGDWTGYGGNVINENGNTVSGGGVELATNICDGDTTCP